MRVVKFFLIPLIVVVLVYVGMVIFIDDDMEDAIDLFEEEEYVDSIKILNELIKVVDYDEGERVYYYRCRAINELSSHLEDELREDLEKLGRTEETAPYWQVLAAARGGRRHAREAPTPSDTER